ncbi:hypothetical protein NHJ13734_008657 [Beauveria thailandica]
MKRKASGSLGGEASRSKRVKASLKPEEAQKRFRDGLFDKKNLDAYRTEYAESSPYKHAVIHELVNDKLLRSVRDEVRANVHFTPKETDIYKIHQSGDLANLDGLDDESLAKLPSLLTLRDAIYSESFRHYVAGITGCGPLSGRKTDMAINVYTPGCYLLCHDDVIGSRRVSYILYLTDPDTPWQPEWGGALRLFPVQEKEGDDGVVAKTPLPDVVKSIPPAWNQLSFFAVQPGQSFHDVEEVYHAETKEQLKKDGGRVRMAISGWFHIPQPGEDGFVPGEEEKNAENSSLMQLRGNPAQYDAPKARVVPVANTDKRGETEGEDADEFDEADLTFLLQYISPTYLTPDTLGQASDFFLDRSIITLDNFLCSKFAERMRKYVEEQEKKGLPAESSAIEKTTPWKVARPPHKHRYLYQQPSLPDELRTSRDESPITELLDHVLPSRAFRHWLAVAAHGLILNHDIVARRFRRGQDYTLATNHKGPARLEMNLSITPTPGWGEDDDGEEAEEEEEEEDEEEAAKPKGKAKAKAKAKADAKGKGKAKAKAAEEDDAKEVDDVGGQEVYMADDDGDGDDDNDEQEDAAVYKTSSDENNILFHQNASWNRLTLVLRDSGTLKFTKYVSRKAQGDRWDIWGLFDIEDEGDDSSDSSSADEAGPSNGGEVALGESDMEKTFNGFSDSGDDESD